MWDPALPPGGLDRVMQQYDNIGSHATRDEGPPWEHPEEDPQPAKKEEVKQAPPEPPQTQEAPARDLRLPPQQQAPADVSGFITPAGKEDDGKVTVIGPAPSSAGAVGRHAAEAPRQTKKLADRHDY